MECFICGKNINMWEDATENYGVYENGLIEIVAVCSISTGVSKCIKEYKEMMSLAGKKPLPIDGTDYFAIYNSMIMSGD